MGIHISLHEIKRAFHRTCGAFAQALNRLALNANDARHMHRAFEELSALSDIELQEVGMMRSDIRAVVTNTYLPAARPFNVLPINQRDRPHSPGNVLQ